MKISRFTLTKKIDGEAEFIALEFFYFRNISKRTENRITKIIEPINARYLLGLGKLNSPLIPTPLRNL